jgi:hypothetical protein
MGECPPQKHNFYFEIHNTDKNGYLKILIGCVWGKGRLERGASCPQIINF